VTALSMAKISIGIVTYNNEGTIDGTLESLITHLPDDVISRIFVIDNGSTDRTIEILAKYQDHITVIHSPRGNIGYGAANNLIINQMDSDVHLIVNPDIKLVDSTSISILYRYLMDHSDVGMAVPRIRDEQGVTQYLCRRNPTFLDLAIRYLPGNAFQRRKDFHCMKDMDYNTSFDVEFASGCFMAINTELFRQIRGFDESYFLYVEDADLTRRVNQISRTVYVPDAVVCHSWARASYKNLKMTRMHLKSLWRYFRKWGFKFK